MNALVTTIIPVYNRPLLLRAAVRSVLAQTYRPIEVIIVDDGSTDETSHMADELAQSCPCDIKVLHVPNGGPGRAREAGRQVAHGEFIQYLDSDDLLLPRKFEVQVAALTSYPDCDIAYGITRLIDEEGRILKAPYKWTGEARETLFPGLLVDRWWNTHTPLWRRSVCNRIGPWSDMWMSEDWEYEARAGALEVKLVHCPEFLSDTRQHRDGRLAGGELTAGKLRDISSLLASLYTSAIKAGVSLDCPEMRHFSRWAFLVARQAGAAGLPSEAKQCFVIARQAAGPERGAGRDFRAYSLLARTLGWANAGKLSGHVERVRREPGANTLKQSWMK